MEDTHERAWLSRFTSRLGEPLPQRVAIVRALPGLGDFLCAVPAWRALRAALPNAHIALIGLPQTAEIATRFAHYIDELIALPGFPGLPDQPPAIRQIPAFLDAMHERHFDLALQMHGNGSITNVVVALLDARITAGLYRPGAYCPDPERFLPYPEQGHEIWCNLQLIEWLGMPLQGDHLEFPLTDADRHAFNMIEEMQGLQPGSYVCFHPGSSTPLRRWSPERFAAVADALAAQGLEIVLTGGAAEVDLAANVAAAMHARAINLAGRTNLGVLAALLDGARLLVCNDTGVAHLAAAVAAPSVVIFTNDVIERWAPLNRDRHRALFDPAGVSVAAVLDEAEDLLRREVVVV